MQDNDVPRSQETGASPCAGCRAATVVADCASAYDRAGVIKAHWECWSDCNLSCSFCYRSRSVPLDTDAAVEMIDALAHGGVRQIVFAGGDPSLRRDLGDLIDAAHDRGLDVEVQTNAQFQPPRVLEALLRADLVGVSLDGATAAVHDAMRGRQGNFAKVLRLAGELDRRARPFVVRTMISGRNADALAGLGAQLSGFTHLRRWSLVQFGAIEDGYRNRAEHEQSDAAFHQTAESCAAEYAGPAAVNIYPNAAKVGVYFLIGSNGDVFGNVAAAAVQQHPVVGNVRTHHASEIAPRLRIRPDAHRDRYLTLISGS